MTISKMYGTAVNPFLLCKSQGLTPLFLLFFYRLSLVFCLSTKALLSTMSCSFLSVKLFLFFCSNQKSDTIIGNGS